MEIKVEILAKERVKPSSPTPNHLKTLDFSIFDIFSPPIYTGGILFFKPPENGEGSELSAKLKWSLSEILTDFYPLAGTITGDSLSCNDEGAVYQEARISCCLSDYLRNPEHKITEGLLPGQVVPREATSWPLLKVQINFFACGGLAIGIRISHMIADAESFAMFVRGWAAAALGTDRLIPEFTMSKFFPPPPQERYLGLFDKKAEPSVQASITKSFLFNASQVAELKAKATSVKNPTRVEAVTALIWTCLTRTSRLLNSGIAKASFLHQPISLRRWMGQKLSKNCFGNAVSAFLLKAGDNELVYEKLIRKLRQEKENFEAISRGILDGDGASSFILNAAKDLRKLAGQEKLVDFYICTSWCSMPFYEADFGCGKPIWVAGTGDSIINNLILLMDSKDGEGVESWVTLSEDRMAVFEQDQELLQYASPSTSIML